MANKVILKVLGMHCSHCENRVCEALKQLEGVQSAKASAKRSRVELVLSDESVLEAAKEAIRQTGFEVVE